MKIERDRDGKVRRGPADAGQQLPLRVVDTHRRHAAMEIEEQRIATGLKRINNGIGEIVDHRVFGTTARMRAAANRHVKLRSSRLGQVDVGRGGSIGSPAQQDRGLTGKRAATIGASA